MKRAFGILMIALMAIAGVQDASAQGSITYSDGKYLQFAHPTSDSIVSQKPIFPTYGSAVSADVSTDTDTIYVNNFHTSITLEDVIDDDYVLSLFAAPYLTIGAQAVISVEADADGRAFTLAGNATGATTAGDTLKHINLFYNGTNFLMCGESLAE
jgi:hypothetical protein